MLWTGVVILQTLSVLSEPTRSEYLSPIVERLGRRYTGYESDIPENIFDGFDEKEETERHDNGSPTSYFYITDSSVEPVAKDCIRCLIPLLKSSSSVDPCDCLPCSVKITGSKFTVPKKLVKYFRHFTCYPIKQAKNDSLELIQFVKDDRNRCIKFLEEYLDDEPQTSKNSEPSRPKRKERKHEEHKPSALAPTEATTLGYDNDELGRTRNYKIEIKMKRDDSLKPALQPQLGIHFRNFKNGSGDESETSKRCPDRKEIGNNRMNPDELARSAPIDCPNASVKNQAECLTGDCEIGNRMDNGKEESSTKVAPELDRGKLKEKVRRVFNGMLSRMEKVNKALEAQKPSEKLSNIPTRRSEHIPGPSDENKRSGLIMYEIPYPRPTYRVIKTNYTKPNYRRMGNLGKDDEQKLKRAESTGEPQAGGNSNRSSESMTGEHKETEKQDEKETTTFSYDVLLDETRKPSNMKSESSKSAHTGTAATNENGTTYRTNDFDETMHYSKLSEDTDLVGTRWSPVYTLPDRPGNNSEGTEYTEDSGEVIGFRNIQEPDLSLLNQKTPRKSGKRTARSHTSRAAESPSRADSENRDVEEKAASWEDMSRKSISKEAQDDTPKFVTEFDEEPRRKSTDPMFNIKVNIYSDRDYPESVYHFLPKLLPRAAEPVPDYARPEVRRSPDKYKFFFPSRNRYRA